MELVRDTKDRENPYAQTARLVLRHTYEPTAQVDFVGPSYFGGMDDQLVLCAGKGAFRPTYCPNTRILNPCLSGRYPYLGTRYCNFAPLHQTPGVRRGFDMCRMESLH
jgi:hypothetical protein